jgi:tetratricopeptide (TPR) repeat protein
MESWMTVYNWPVFRCPQLAGFEVSPEVNNRGNTRRAKGDLEGALQDYSEAIRLRSDDVAALTNRGAARHATGNLEGALEDYAEAIRLDPNYPAAIYNRGNARLAKGDLELARRDHSEAIRLGYKPN